MTEFTAKASIHIDASKEEIWEALVNPEMVKNTFTEQPLLQTGKWVHQLYSVENGRVKLMKTKGMFLSWCLYRNLFIIIGVQ